MALRVSEWRKLPVSLTELCINTTLRCGQSFRWRKSAEDEWSIALHGRILTLRQDQSYLHYKDSFPASSTPQQDDTEDLIKHYFNLGPNLTELYAQWSAADANFKKRAPKFTGIRILRQDAWEALVGFICSSNNNIIRISQMVHKLCVHYGPLIGHVEKEPYHDFPTPAALTGKEVEQHLRQLGFGYRARYIAQTAVMVAAHDSGWLDSLRNPESPLLGREPKPTGEMLEGGREGYRQAHEQLLALQGVGPKVADCVSLMGLGWGEAVPVDTHVWQIAVKDYKFGKGKHSSLTKATYDAVGNKFRSLWGKEAGWAHSVLFTADLKAFAERLVPMVETLEIKEEIKLEGELGIKREIKGEDGAGVDDTAADSSRLSSADASTVEDESLAKKPTKRGRKTKKVVGRGSVAKSEVTVKAEPESPANKLTVKSEFMLGPADISSFKREAEEDKSHVDAADMMSRIKRRRRG